MSMSNNGITNSIDDDDDGDDGDLKATTIGSGNNGKVSMEHIVWKQVFSNKKKKKEGELIWEKQRLVLDGSKVCTYKVVSSKPDTPEEDKFVRDKDRYKQMDQSRLLLNAVARSLKNVSSSAGLTNNNTSSNINSNSTSSHTKLQETRSSLNMLEDKVSVKGLVAGVPVVEDVSSNKKASIPSLSSLSLALTPSSSSKLKVGFTPTPFEMYLHSKRYNVKWRICFETEIIQREWIAALKCVRLDAKDAKKASIKEDHGFEPGDHIIRWTILPIPAWPIQIHGIVLEAGRNCIIIADFGLTSYGKQESLTEQTPTAGTEPNQEEAEEESSKLHFEKIVKSFKAMQPKEKKRLNVIVVTNPAEIKKWNKINYGRESLLSPGKLHNPIKVPKWLTAQMNKMVKNNSKNDDSKSNQRLQQQQLQIQQQQQQQLVQDGKCGRWAKKGYVDQSEDGEVEHHPSTKSGRWTSKAHLSASPTRNKKISSHTTATTSGEDDQNAKQNNLNSSSSAKDNDNSNISCHPPVKKRRWTEKETNIGLATLNEEDEEDESSNKLPSSDPAKIVLARTHFLLEHGDEFLPSYHVFHSNSECIAVWCKTGQWSTLQASIFLTSTCIGNAKSATVLTMGTAAAHAILFPAVAVGGLVMVTAPYVILKKSKEKWAKSTKKLNDLFWSMAEPDVFVSAIENWSGMDLDD